MRVSSSIFLLVALPAEAASATTVSAASVGAAAIRQNASPGSGIEAHDKVYGTLGLESGHTWERGESTVRFGFKARGGSAGIKGERFGKSQVDLGLTRESALGRIDVFSGGERSIEEADGASLALGEQLGLAGVPRDLRARTEGAGAGLSYSRQLTARLTFKADGSLGVAEREVVSRHRAYELGTSYMLTAPWSVGVAFSERAFAYGDDDATFAGPSFVSSHAIDPVTTIELRAGVQTSSDAESHRTEFGRVRILHKSEVRDVELGFERGMTQPQIGASVAIQHKATVLWRERFSGPSSVTLAGHDRRVEDGANDSRVEAYVTIGLGRLVGEASHRSSVEVSCGASLEEAKLPVGRARRETLNAALTLMM